MQVLSEMPVDIGGEEELRASLGMGGRDKRVDASLLRARLEAHYWFLAREALRCGTVAISCGKRTFRTCVDKRTFQDRGALVRDTRKGSWKLVLVAVGFRC